MHVFEQQIGGEHKILVSTLGGEDRAVVANSKQESGVLLKPYPAADRI